MSDKEKGKDGTQHLMVAVRVRPLNGTEVEDETCTEIVHALDENLVVLKDPNEDQDDILRANRSREKQYIFDCAFGPNSNQAEVYKVVAKPLIENVITGYNATVFAYGATGAGKTFTMLGTDREPGIMARALNDLFFEMDKTKEDMKYKVSMSYLEIYNEMIRDLLNPSSGFLELREDSRGVVVAGISEVQAKKTSEVMDLLVRGNKQRTSEPTAANKTSSRSHAILQVTVNQKSRVKNTIDEFRVGKLFMIDLAGSERAAQTKNRGKRMIEGAHINRSLLALGNCINALSENRGHYINYRDSKLTRLLKDSLGGNCRTVMIAHASPASGSFEETRNTLLYADRAKNIKTNFKPNQFSVSYHIAQYTNIIADLRKEIFRLKLKISDTDQNDSNSTNGQHKEKNPEEMNKLRDQLVSTFKEQMDIRRKLIELEDTAMQVSLDMNRYMLVIDEWEQEKARRGVRKTTRSSSEKTDNYDLRDDLTNLATSENENREKSDESSPQYKNFPGENRREVTSLSTSDSLEDVENKDLDTEKDAKSESNNDESAGITEPEEVSFAREEISTLIAEEKRTSDLKVDLQGKLQQTRKEVETLEELLPKKISSEENREILGLLCKVHELEITNAELQSNSLLRENLLRQKELEMNKYESRQRLCDEIIQMQRVAINDSGVQRSAELEALYGVYMDQSADFEQRENSASTQENAQGSLSTLQKASLLAGLNRRMMPLARERLFTFSKLSPLSEETPSRLMSLQNSPVKMSRATPSAHTQMSDDVFTREASSPLSLPTPKRTKKLFSFTDDGESERSTPATVSSVTEDGNEELKPVTTPASPVFARTRKISEIAARRRLGLDKSLSNGSRISLGPDDELPTKSNSVTDMRTHDQAAGSEKVKADKGLSVKASRSMSDLSVIDKRAGDVSSEDSAPVDKRKGAVRSKVKKVPQRKPRRLRSASLDDSKVLRVKPRLTRKEELQEAARQKVAAALAQANTRNRVYGGGLGTEGRKAGGARRPRGTSIPRPAPVQGVEHEGGKTTVKPAMSAASNPQDGELQTFWTNVTPPSTVHQYGVSHGKGHTIQKRYRGPPEISGTDSNQSTPRLKPRKKPPKTGTRSVDELSVSGVAVRPAKQAAGTRRS